MRKINGVISGMLLVASLTASAQETQFLSNNHALYRIDQNTQNKNYLLLPVQESAEMSNVKVIADNAQLKAFNVRLASNHVDYYVPLDLSDSRIRRDWCSTSMSMATIAMMVVSPPLVAGRICSSPILTT